MDNDLKQKGTLTSLWNAHGKAIKYISLGGLLLSCCFLPTAAVLASATPGFNLLDIGAQFYNMAFNAAAQNFAPGWASIGEATLNTAADISQLALP